MNQDERTAHTCKFHHWRNKKVQRQALEDRQIHLFTSQVKVVMADWLSHDGATTAASWQQIPSSNK